MTYFKKYADFLYILLANLVAFVFIWYITRGNIDLFAVDDNIKQWEPILRPSFDYLFSHGSIPYIDFYQYNKMNTFDVGYYGLNNPFMLLAYIISRFIFAFSINVLPIYIVMMVMCGNIFMYLLLKKIGISQIEAFFSTIAYASTPFFYIYAFYHFSFNNYFFIPFFLYVLFISYEKKTGYIFPGICLSLAMSLGHAQYLAYYYMLYGIIEVLLILFFKNKKQIAYFVSNLTVAIVLSLPMALSLMEAGQRRIANFTNYFFFSEAMNPKFLLNSFIMRFPDGILSAFETILHTAEIVCWGLNVFILLFFIAFFVFKKLVRNTDTALLSFKNAILIFLIMTVMNIFRIDFASQIIGLLLLMTLFLMQEYKKINNIYFCLLSFSIFIPEVFVFIVLWLLWHQKEKNNCTDNLLYGILLGAVFFEIFSFGRKSFLADILFLFPVLDNFRYLYKCTFFVLPLMSICAFSSFKFVEKKIYKRLILLLLIISIGQNIFYSRNFLEYNHTYVNTYFSNYRLKTNEYLQAINSHIEQLKVDVNNYRILGVTLPDRFEASNAWSCYLVSKADPELIAANYATINHVFSFGGYDDGFSEDYFNQTKNISLPYVRSVWNNYLDPSALTGIKLQKFSDVLFWNQIENNAVKYFLLYKEDAESLSSFKKLCNKKYEIVRIEPFSKDVLLIELPLKKGLISSDLRDKINLKHDIAKLEFSKIKNEKKIRLAFSYDKHYKATFCENNSCSDVTIKPDELQYTILVFNEEQANKSGKIVVTYTNTVCDLAILCTILTVLLIITCFIIIRREKHER